MTYNDNLSRVMANFRGELSVNVSGTVPLIHRVETNIKRVITRRALMPPLPLLYVRSGRRTQNFKTIMITEKPGD